ncbi:DUF4177 domain-containing protein [Rhodobacter ferrooxidans]|uniref:DUF4177 domain-containing protein n=1 Tax=Rhodobacter ferrooxidans TaxID=371731 RepID=C8S2N1_9RHOB|nr:DUF4177 domain-containing protein [Rhodobacter sp. SW2]EEW24707.1 conserved hypothetical protein [Rhodobacter sp. SW2]
MSLFEYKILPAPRRGEKSREAKTTVDRFALTLSQQINALARDGWEYLRADTLPCDERSGLTGTATHFHAMLVFRRKLLDLPAVVVTPMAVAPLPTVTVDAPSGAAPSLGPAPIR